MSRSPIAVPDVFGDEIRVIRIEPQKVARKGCVRIEINDMTWVGTRAQFLELTHAMTEMAVELTP